MDPEKDGSCDDGYFTVKIIVENKKNLLSKPIAFVDSKTAFDRVSRRNFLEILASDDVP